MIVLKEVDLLLEAEKACRIYSKIRLVVDEEELEGRRRTMYCLHWPKNLIELEKKSKSQFRRKQMVTNAEIDSFDLYSLIKKKYDELKVKNYRLDYIRFSNLRNYFLTKRLQLLTEEQKGEIEISFAVRDTRIDSSVGYFIEEKTVREFQVVEDGEWAFNLRNGFKTKIPAYYGALIFIGLGIFEEKRITITDRHKVDSNTHTDENSISNRFVIRNDEKRLYNKAAEVTYQNLRKLVDDRELLAKCKKYLRRYNQVKEGI